MPNITYDSNNSGGSWWLDSKHWNALHEAGWAIGRISGLGNVPASASKDFPTIEAAVSEWTVLTGLDPYAEGCRCCGPPHYFYET